ncbi:tetratricopeptide repeat protein [Sorangium sp. So ce1182]|uniref:CHAT domain-containing tetratricopeptide repeat protein n=1 Tax=Sorangium sp. So ce1182 TaxID=3133334 RepID=UPI003F5F086F
MAAAILTAVAGVAHSAPVGSSSKALHEARRLHDEADSLLKTGKYDAAIPLLNRALSVREKRLGPKHLDVAQSLTLLGIVYWHKGDYARAEPLYQRALAIDEKALGPEHPDVAQSLNNLAVLYNNKGDYARAEQMHQRALAIREKALGPEHPDVAQSLNNFAILYNKKGDYARAEQMHQRALAIREKALGPEHPDVAQSLSNMAAAYWEKGDYAQVEPMCQRALAIREKALGPEHPDVAQSLNDLAIVYRDEGDYDRAEPLHRRALAIREKALGPEHPDVAQSLNDLAFVYLEKADYDRAEPLYQRALTIREKALGPEHPDVAQSLNDLAFVYRNKGYYDQAERLHRRALAIREKVLGPEHLDVAESLNGLADVYVDRGDYTRAEPLNRRALAIREKVLGPEHPDVASSLNTIARVNWVKGDYALAEKLHRRALTYREKALGPEHPGVAQSLDNLASVYRDNGEYARAEPLYERALAIREKALGPEHLDVAQSLDNLASIYRRKCDRARAEPLFQRALSIREKALGSAHLAVADSLDNLAALYKGGGEYARAKPLFERELAIREKLLGPEHLDVTRSLKGLAMLYDAQGEHARAEPLLQRALAIVESSLGPDHVLVADALSDLATLYDAQGEHARVEPLLRRALAIREKALGPKHPDVAISLGSLSTLYLARGDVASARRFMTRAGSIEDGNSGIAWTIESDERKRMYMESIRANTYKAVSLHVLLSPTDEDARRFALETILSRKGRELDVMADSFGMLRRRLSSRDRDTLDQLRSINGQISAITWRGPGKTPLSLHQTLLTQLEQQRQQLEAEMIRRSVDLGAQMRQIRVEDVRSAIPEGAALLELFMYRPFNRQATAIGRWGEPHYVAYVLKRGGSIDAIDLGKAALIDAAVERLRRALARAAADPRPAARALDALVMQPVRRLLGPIRWVFLSPDGALNLVPFSALMDEEQRYLVEQYAFSYITSGRDLLRLKETPMWRQGDVVIAASDFNSPAIAHRPVAEGSPRRSADMKTLSFPPLPFAVDEGRAISRLLRRSKVLIGPSATEREVKVLSGPRILHIATHGFFLPDQEEEQASLACNVEVNQRGLNEPQLTRSPMENPLLRSGLVFSSANRSQDAKDDGVLTALEASQLDLLGTKLIVMSACETGVGEVHSGDGVYGLRRALAIAGAETQVMSLWNVDDEATRTLMEAYYGELLAGGGRGESLRRVQLTMLKNSEWAKLSHPHYWAAFIVSGNDAALDGTPVQPDFARVRPGLRGCGCWMGASSSEGVGALGAVLAIAALRLRRRRPIANHMQGRYDLTSSLQRQPRRGTSEDGNVARSSTRRWHRIPPRLPALAAPRCQYPRASRLYRASSRSSAG